MDIVEIMAILPHRYPFLLIDRVIEMERKTRIVAIKNVTMNEPHFTGTLSGLPDHAGVLTVEAMAQAGGALLLTEIPLTRANQADGLYRYRGRDVSPPGCAGRSAAHRGDGAQLATHRGEAARGRLRSMASLLARRRFTVHAGCPRRQEAGEDWPQWRD